MLADLRAALLDGPNESCAVLLGHTGVVPGGPTRIVVRDMVQPPLGAYIERSPIKAQLRPEFVAEVVMQARRGRNSLVFVHTHPFELNEFSPIDDQGEAELVAFLSRRMPGVPHAALLLTPSASIARILGTTEALHLAEVGPTVSLPGLAPDVAEAVFDRQVRAFGLMGQKILTQIRVGIVGLGGTGSVIAQQLAHLGVEDFLLMDPDRLEETNLNRVVGATRADIGRPKVEIAADHIQRIRPTANVDAQVENVLGTKGAHQLAGVDFIFCCTDSHGSRAVINQIAYQYLVPTIDLGVVIDASDGPVTHIAGRVQMLAPGMSCLVCGNLLDSEQVRRDFLSEDERKRDPYILGATEPQPAVISLNSTVSSLAVTMFLNAVTGIPGNGRLLNYNALTGTIRPAAGEAHPQCVICSRSGSFARGDSWDLPTINNW